MMLIIRESDLRNPFDLLAALARRCETTDYDATDGWHVLMAAIKHLQKQGVEADAFREGKETAPMVGGFRFRALPSASVSTTLV